ncbi:putative Fe-S cluster assembly protein SufT [bacterium]|jgi:probable FeS assembly SUF system protein SufT|nr:putative Fe-S cluster assembly protein SufT [bacterium]NBW56172.1 putative Fe-S cluster assembly protein SufT [bacterium]NBX72261.1 putative Fe-S cluster assembly protein SufT [bacterium]
MVQQSKTAILSRDVEGVLIPAGTPIVLPEGMPVQITQALGHSLTLFVNGNLVRLYGHDADAVGYDFSVPAINNENGSLTEGDVMTALRNIYDPEIPVNIVDLGLIYDCEIQNHEKGIFLKMTMTLTAPGCGMGPILAQDVERVCKSFKNVYDAHVDVVFDPPWRHDMMTEAAKLQLGLI